MGPLAGLRILDLSRVLAGPWVGQTLADLGAEVIKVENPDGGDDTRAWGPPFVEGTDESAYFLSANRGKKSIAIDMRSADGQQLIRRLAATSDAVIENFKVGGLAAYGLDYPSLRQVKPALVYCSITGFGQDGPYARRPGYDFMIQGLGGLMSITGDEARPTKVGVAVADLFTGMYATCAVVAALFHSRQTGQGQHIDMALLDCQVAMLANQAGNYLVSGQAPVPMGNAHPNIVPYQAFATADGHFILAVGNDAQFSRFCAVAGRPDWAADPRFATNRDRVANRALLVAAIEALTRTRPGAAWIADLEAVQVPCGPINDLAGVFADPQVRHRGLAFRMPHDSGVDMPQVASPMRFSATPVEYRQPPPRLGQHSREVLRELLGCDEASIGDWIARGVVAEPANPQGSSTL